VADSPATNKMSEAITRTLPFLRRYARAVTGSQKRGDEWVRLCCYEVVMAQPGPDHQGRGYQARRLHLVPIACGSLSAIWRKARARTA